MNAGARRVLVVEDEVSIAEAVAARLRAEGFEVHLAHDGPSAVAAEAAIEPDVVVLDVMLPGFDGIEVCRRIQARRPVPVLMVTARDDETDILVGLGVGADDYLTKPFSIRELAARVHALLRRVDRAAEAVQQAVQQAGPAEPERPRIALGAIEIDPAERRVHRAGTEVHLTPIEFELLVYLARRPRAVQPRERLLAEVWGWAAEAVGALETRTVDSHVKALRRKLGADLIRTVHGVGYALQVRR
jgi:DNA-binding response OmpR family regulator